MVTLDTSMTPASFTLDTSIFSTSSFCYWRSNAAGAPAAAPRYAVCGRGGQFARLVRTRRCQRVHRGTYAVGALMLRVGRRHLLQRIEMN